MLIEACKKLQFLTDLKRRAKITCFAQNWILTKTIAKISTIVFTFGGYLLFIWRILLGCQTVPFAKHNHFIGL